MKKPTMIRAKGDGVEIQLAVWEGRGIPVICVHGLTANCRCWDVMVQPVADRHRVLALDLRGRGLSDKPATGYSEAHHIRDLKCPVMILRATDGILVDDDILLPGDSVGKMLSEIPDARVVDIAGTNHYSILFQPNSKRDSELLAFLGG